MAISLSKAISVARSQKGYREHGQNDTKYNRWLGRIPGYPHGGYGYPWCHSFVSWVSDQAGGTANTDYPKTAGCAVGVAWFKRSKRWSNTPHVGDLVYYGPGGSTHVELVVGVSPSYIRTIGGNTSGSLSGRYFNGDGVYEKTVARSSSRIYGYGRPNYGSSTSKPAPAPVAKPQTAAPKPKVALPTGKPLLRKGAKNARTKALQQHVNWALNLHKHVGVHGLQGKLKEDGEYGKFTELAVLLLQKYHNRNKGRYLKYTIDEDGVYGDETKKALAAIERVDKK